MSEYEQSAAINVEAADVFDFVSDIANLPRYLPSVHNATARAGGRVRTEGGEDGHHYESEGFYCVDRERLRMEWGSDGDQYRGWMEVKAAEGAASTVTVHLTFEGKKEGGEPDREIEDGLKNALESIKLHCEGGHEAEPRKAEGHVERRSAV